MFLRGYGVLSGNVTQELFTPEVYRNGSKLTADLKSRHWLTRSDYTANVSALLMDPSAETLLASAMVNLRLVHRADSLECSRG